MKTRYRFNLIEIILTVAVIAFGVVVILGMLPKGLAASRTAGFESYSSEIVDQMGNYLQRNGAKAIEPTISEGEESDFLSKDFKSAETTPGKLDRTIMAAYPKLVSYIDLSKNFDNEKVITDDGPQNLDELFSRTNTAGVFKLKDGTQKYEQGIYVIVMGNSYSNVIATDKETETRIDFSGMLRTWKRSRSYENVRVNNDTDYFSQPDTDKETNFKLDVLDAPMTSSGDIKGAVVYMELSYPLSLPYAERTKRYYSFEVGE